MLANRPWTYLHSMSTLSGGTRSHRSLTVPSSLTAASQCIEVVSSDPAPIITNPARPVFTVYADVNMRCAGIERVLDKLRDDLRQ